MVVIPYRMADDGMLRRRASETRAHSLTQLNSTPAACFASPLFSPILPHPHTLPPSPSLPSVRHLSSTSLYLHPVSYPSCLSVETASLLSNRTPSPAATTRWACECEVDDGPAEAP